MKLARAKKLFKASYGVLPIELEEVDKLKKAYLKRQAASNRALSPYKEAEKTNEKFKVFYQGLEALEYANKK